MYPLSCLVYNIRLRSNACNMLMFETRCGHSVKAVPVKSSDGPKRGKWQVRISGPSITLQRGIKCLYSDANSTAVIEAVATYLGVDIRELHKPLTLPCIVLALDFETSDWDEQCTFARQDAHFNAGFPCRADHKSAAGHICAIGYSVFRQDSNSPRTYYVEEQVSVAIQLPDGQSISKQAIDAHGITDQICARGQQLTTVLHAVIGWLKQGAEICCHNLAHETLIVCREFQKRSLIGHSVLPEEDASLFLRSLYTGHCTLQLGKRRNGFFRALADEFHLCFSDVAQAGKRHEPGRDAYMCAQLFLYYNEARLTKASFREIEERPSKKSRSDIA